MLDIFKILALVLVLVAGPPWSRNDLSSIEDQNPASFLVAVLRADGALVPFAQYGNGGFYNPWPKPQPCRGCIDEIYPHSLGGLPQPWFVQGGRMPKRWYFRSSNGALTVLKALKITEVENHSQKNWAVRTDFPHEPVESSHHRNLGVAITANIKIESMIESKPEPDGLTSIIKDVFDAEETIKIERLATDDPSGTASLFRFGLPESAAERKRAEKTITKFHRSESPINGEYLYYFKAKKEYEMPRLDGHSSSGHVSLFSGWATVEARQGGSSGIILSEIVFTDTDMKGPTTSLPLGILKLSGRTFIFVEEHGWEDESYLVLELNGGIHRLLETFGG